MNVIKLYGGLGNQLFQWAFGYVMETIHKIPVAYDKSWFNKPTDPPRPYGLSFFKMVVNEQPFLPGNKTIHEKGFMSQLLSQNGLNLFGYWQYLGYYREVLPDLRDLIKIKPEFYSPEYLKYRELIRDGSISLHVRRGDYVTVNGHILLPLSYYLTALQYFPDATEVFVFSDDIPWCQRMFDAEYLPYNIHFVDIAEIYAMELMSLCTYHIIANSTFSWWGAMLDDKPHKEVVAPQLWRVNPEEQMKMENGIFVPLEWKRL